MRRMSAFGRSVALVLSVGLLSPVVLAAIATHRHYGSVILDGIEGVDEWAGAEAGSLVVILPSALGGSLGIATLWVMSDELYLYLGLRFPYHASPGSPAGIGLIGRAFPAGVDPCTTLVDEFAVLSQDEVALVYDQFLLNCDIFDLDENDSGSSDTTGAWSDAGRTIFFEMRQPLASGDDLHDIDAPPPGLIVLNIFAFGCDGESGDCGTPGAMALKVYLPTAETIFFDDFESEDTSYWTVEP